MTNKINFNYLNRDFSSLKKDLKNYIKVYYPEQYNDFSESSIGMMLLELNAYVGDILSYHVDKNFNELWMDSAKNRKSVFQIAKNLGYKPQGKRPSVTLLDVSIEVPPGSGEHDFDDDYLITLESGFKARALNGTTFEVVENINFDEHKNLSGIVNRTITPIYNNNNEIIHYRITKRMGAVAGETKTTVLEVTPERVKPFLKWYIDNEDDSITEVLNVITKSDRFSPTDLSDWTYSGPNHVWYKVDSLPQEKIFVDTTHSSDGSEGYWKYVQKRFMVDYNENGLVYLTFGGGIENFSLFQDFLTSGIDSLIESLLLSNDSLGEIPGVGMYLHCRYRSGGGSNTNTPKGNITSIVSRVVTDIKGGGSIDISDVLSSISCTNPIPAIGGKDHPTLEEIKSRASHHYSSQDRCVTLNDYISRISLLPAKYGSIFRSHATTDSESMNTRIYILTKDENGKLKNTGNSTIKSNLAAYLSKYKILNDFIIIDDGRILNLALDFKVQVEQSYNKKEVIINCIDKLKDFFDIGKWEMSDTIYMSHIVELLRKQPGVINVVDLTFKNKIGGNYSNDILSGELLTDQDLIRAKKNGEIIISPVNNKIKAPLTGMFEVKYPDRDLKGSAI